MKRLTPSLENETLNPKTPKPQNIYLNINKIEKIT
jgi:hypothetical protein